MRMGIRFRYVSFRAWFRVHARKLQVMFWVAINTFKLAPDRYFTVAGVIFALTQPYHKSWPTLLGEYGSKIEQLGLEDQHFYLISVCAILVVSIVPTIAICKRDHVLYSRIITENINSRHALHHLSSIALSMIFRVQDADPAWPADLRLNSPQRTLVRWFRQIKAKCRDLFAANDGVYEALSNSRADANVLENSKDYMSPRFGLEPRVFADQFLQFSPAIFNDRVTKLGMNLTNIRNSDDKEYCDKLIGQNRKIQEWINHVQNHLLSMRRTTLDMNQVESLFMAESTSGSVQRLAFIIQYERPLYEDLHLLFQILGSYRGRSLFRRLLAITLAESVTRLKKAAGNAVEKERELQVLKDRLFIIKSAETWHKSGKPRIFEIYKKRLSRRNPPRSLNNWWEQVASYVFEQRKEVVNNLRRELDEILQGNNKVTIVVDSYSRAVRTCLRSALPEDAIDRIRVFMVTPEDRKKEFGLRLLYHVVTQENWEPHKGMPKINAGKLSLLRSIVQKNEYGLYLTGVASIKSSKEVYGTSNTTEIDNIASEFNAGFSKFALAGAYKFDWPVFYHHFAALANEHDLYKLVLDAATGHGIKPDSLTYKRDSLTGGLYILEVDQVISDMPNDDLRGVFRNHKNA